MSDEQRGAVLLDGAVACTLILLLLLPLLGELTRMAGRHGELQRRTWLRRQLRGLAERVWIDPHTPSVATARIAGEVAIAGDFVIRDPSVGEIRIIPDPRTGRVEWVDCNIDLYEICPGNLGTFDLAAPVDPLCGDNCGTVPATTLRWGEVKSVYRTR